MRLIREIIQRIKKDGPVDYAIKSSLVKQIDGSQPFGANIEYLWDQLRIKIEDGDIDSIYDFLEIPDNAENRFTIISNYMELFINQNKWLSDQNENISDETAMISGINLNFINLIITLDNILNGITILNDGSGFENRSWFRKLNDSKSFVRHLVRSGTQASILLENINPEMAKEQGTSKSELKWSIFAAWFHDIGRLISQESDHDDWGEKLMLRLKIRSEIVSAKHNPVPIEGDVDDFDPDTFDSPTQKITRLVDVGGKIDLATNQLRDNVDAMKEYSKTVQLGYLKRNDPLWASIPNPEKAIENYTDKEAKALESAIDFLQKIGINWTKIIGDLNIGGSKRTSIFSSLAK